MVASFIASSFIHIDTLWCKDRSALPFSQDWTNALRLRKTLLFFNHDDHPNTGLIITSQEWGAGQPACFAVRRHRRILLLLVIYSGAAKLAHAIVANNGSFCVTAQGKPGNLCGNGHARRESIRYTITNEVRAANAREKVRLEKAWNA